MKWIPHAYQAKATRFLLANPCCALIQDMGLGKTIEVLTAVQKLMNTLDVRRCLVVGPIRVIEDTWPGEIAKWDHVNLTFRIIRGRLTEREQKIKNRKVTIKANPNAQAALSADVDIHLINYEGLPSFIEWCLSQKELPWDMIVWDESSKMKDWSSTRFKLFKPLIKKFKRRIILSATPAAEGYLGIWAQYYLLDEGKRLGAFISKFRERYFVQVDKQGFDWRIREGAEREIQDLVRDITLTMKAEDYLDMPDFVENDVVVEMPPAVKAMYKEFEREMYAEIEAGGVEAFNREAVSARCRQITSGAVYPVDRITGVSDTTQWSTFHTAKIDAAEAIVEEAQGSPVLIMYEWRHELARLRERFPKAAVIGGGTSNAAASSAILAWNAGKVPVMIAHPQSIGHGVNLQYGGHILVWVSGTWSGELYKQTRGRLYRQGQEHPVIQHRIVVKGTVDIAVKAANAGKAKTNALFMLALKECV